MALFFLVENSRIIRSIDGQAGHWAFLHPRNVLRIEYHSGRGALNSNEKDSDAEGFTLKYTALKN